MTLFRTAVLLALLAPGAGDQATLLVVGPTGQSRSVAQADLVAMSAREVTVTEPHGQQVARYRGVPLLQVLASVGAPTGDALRGKALALHVRAEASDGYVVTFSLAELDPAVGATDAILAFEREGQPLGSDVGPFRLVVPSDKRAARWVRNLIKLTVLD